MPARAYWSGQLRLALVSIPVEVYSATRSASGIAFRQIHEPSGKPVKYEKIVPGIGPVDPDEIIKGYEYEKGEYVLLSDDEIENVKLESRKTLELTQFVEAGAIEAIWFERPFWVVPADELAEEAYRVMRDALRAAKKVGLGQLALRGRETIVAVKPCGRGLLMETLRYAEEVNKAAPFFRAVSDAESPPELVELATSLIERRSAPFDATAFKDHYEDALRALIGEKLKGRLKAQKPQAEPAERPSNVVDLMAALKQSLEKGGASEGGSGPARPERASRAKAGAKPAARKRA